MQESQKNYDWDVGKKMIQKVSGRMKMISSRIWTVYFSLSVSPLIIPPSPIISSPPPPPSPSPAFKKPLDKLQ